MNIIEAITSCTWAIQPEVLRLILEVANRERSDSIVEALEKRKDIQLENARLATTRNDVAIIPVSGPIFKYANMFTMISGGSSLQILMRDLNTALENPDIKNIILNIDSPGGEVNGVSEFANAIYAARSQKNIVAYVGGLGASAAYWIASAASQIVVDETALVGSIGVVASYIDDSERMAKEGVKEIEIISSTSPNKRPNPASEDGRAVIQARVDAIQEVFVETVARNRGVAVETVLEDFGKGDVLIGKNAVQVGLADRLGSLEGVIEALSTNHINQKETAKMSTKNDAASYTAEEITPQFILDNFPAIAEGFREDGKLAERVRIQEIHALSRPGLEELIHDSMFHTDSDAGEVALRIIEKDKIRRKAESAALKEDAKEVPPLAANAPESDEAAEQKMVDAAVIHGLNKRVNI